MSVDVSYVFVQISWWIFYGDKPKVREENQLVQ